MKENNKRLVTEARLESALERLFEGNPERTKPDGKISLKRINDEAGLSSGSIYYYKDFVVRARAVISEIKSKTNTNNYSVSKSDIAKLRAERDKQKQLKERYREQRDDIKRFADGVIQENAKLHFSLHEALIAIEQLEKELSASKITKISERQK